MERLCFSYFIFWFYIKPQLFRSDIVTDFCCFIFWFYIKPQLLDCIVLSFSSCFIFWFYIKPQHSVRITTVCCFIFWFYIKPQHNSCSITSIIVASYFDSTSNHNPWQHIFRCYYVASYFDSTSNHNRGHHHRFQDRLLHILILHQTTTHSIKFLLTHCCFIFWFYIKPQRSSLQSIGVSSCFIFWFYIKPQHFLVDCKRKTVASYFDSTSNHNSISATLSIAKLLHILILHQTTTFDALVSFTYSCFIFWFYIKPQHNAEVAATPERCFIFWFYIKPQLPCRWSTSNSVASYFDSTSNHNKTALLIERNKVASYFDSTSNHNHRT